MLEKSKTYAQNWQVTTFFFCQMSYFRCRQSVKKVSVTWRAVATFAWASRVDALDERGNGAPTVIDEALIDIVTYKAVSCEPCKIIVWREVNECI